MELTREEMLAAMRARKADHDPNFNSGIEAVRGWVFEQPPLKEVETSTQMPPELEVDEVALREEVEEAEEEYYLGKRILEGHTLRFTARTRTPKYADGTLSFDVPDDATGWMVVDAGHIAQSPAYRCAIFRRRS